MDGSVSLPFRSPITIGSALPKRKPRTFHAGHERGWAGPSLPPAPCASILPRTTPSLTSAAAGHTGARSTLSPPQNLRSVFFGPRDHNRFTSQHREKHRGRWRSFWTGVQAPLRSPHRPPLVPPFSPSLVFVGRFFPRAAIASPRHWKPWIHRRHRRHNPRQHRPTEPAPSRRRQLL